MSLLTAFGIVDRGPADVSDALRRLNMSHTLAWRSGIRNCAVHIDGLSAEQPVWPVVVDSLRTLSKITLSGRYVPLVVDSRAQLTNTNLGRNLWPENWGSDSFDQALASTLVSVSSEPETWVLKIEEPSIMDYVNTAVRPSQLTKFQTLVYKINPYQLRKEVQALCIGYLAGTVKASTLKTKLESSYKLAPLVELMREDRTRELKAAIAEVQADMTKMNQVTKATGFQSFEIMYFIKASANQSSAKVKPGAGRPKKRR